MFYCHISVTFRSIVGIFLFVFFLQFLLYIDSTNLGSPMEIETDSIGIDDVTALKKTVEEEATQVYLHC